MSHFVEKRKDHLLRTSINSLQSLMVNNKNSDLLYERTLKSALEISGSSFGAIVRLNYVEEAPMRDYLAWMSQDVKTGDYVFRTSNRYDENLNAYWVSFLEHPVPIMLNRTPCLSFLECLPEHYPEVLNSVALPVLNRGKVTALLILINRKIDYDQFVIDRLSPLLTTFNCIVRASECITANVDVSPEISSDSYHSRHLSRLIDASLNGIVTVDETEHITTFNAAAEAIFGVKSKEIIGESFDRFISNAQDIMPFFLASKNRGGDEFRPFSAPKIWRNIAGRRSCNETFLMDLSAFQSQFGTNVHTTFVIDDISDRINSAQESKEALQRFKALTNLAPVGIIQVDNNWECHYVNDTWNQLSGLSREETLGKGWVDAIHRKDSKDVLDGFKEATKTGKAFRKSFRLQTPLGLIFWVKVNARALYDEFGQVNGFLGTFSDITDHLATEKKLRDIVEYDQLTGLVNRSFFKDRLQLALESSYRRGSVNLLLIDLDGFKSVNDTFGHGVGDKMLKISAERIKKAVREEDTVARLSGDEFTVILTHMHDDTMASRVATKIICLMREPFVIDSQEIFITTSVGIAISDESNADPETLINQADIGLHRAKTEGKNKFQFFTPELDAQAKARMFLSNGLHRALERQELVPYYQPQIDTNSGNIVGFEALIRWHHPEKGELLPQQFIPLLEETGLIDEVGLWMIQQSCQQLSVWMTSELQNEGLLTMSVNLSARQLKDPSLPEKISDILNDANLEGKHLIIEITETVLMDDADDNKEMLRRLRALGIGIALDDFGTGYSSLAYLKRFPINHLKIDRSFVRDILHDADDEAIILAILAMAKSLNLNVIAEGVENGAVLDRLKSYGCECYQGFYFSEPEPADGIIARFYSEENEWEAIAG